MKGFKCDQCHRLFKTMQGLRGHERLAHKTQIVHDSEVTQHSSLSTQLASLPESLVDYEHRFEIEVLQMAKDKAKLEAEIAQFDAIRGRWEQRLQKLEKKVDSIYELVCVIGDSVHCLALIRIGITEEEAQKQAEGFTESKSGPGFE